MHPVLIELGWFNIYSFGFMLAVSFLLGIYVSAYRAKRFGVNPQYMLDLSVYVIIGAIFGSRFLYVIFHLDDYRNVLDMFALWQGGANYYGGLLVAILASYFFAHRKKVDFLLLADIVSPSLALGNMVTRIGCFLSGCCFGKPTDLPWGVVFPPGSAAGTYARSIVETAGEVAHLHPTQLYESCSGLVTFLFLMLSGRWLRKRGSTFGAFLVCYAVFRFSVDFIRHYESDMLTGFGLTWNQVVSVILLFAGFFFLKRKTGLKSEPVVT